MQFESVYFFNIGFKKGSVEKSTMRSFCRIKKRVNETKDCAKSSPIQWNVSTISTNGTASLGSY